MIHLRQKGALMLLLRGTMAALAIIPGNVLAESVDEARTSSSSIEQIIIINADSDQSIRELSDGMQLDLAKLPSRKLNLQAITIPERVGSVRFELNGVKRYREESVAPYALAGDKIGDFNPWIPRLGEHYVEVTPIGKDGTPGDALRIHFSVIDISFFLRHFSLRNVS